jgi:hypothetical protein
LAQPKRWRPLDLPFLQPGYEYHQDEGFIRHGRGNVLQDYRDKGIPRVTVVAQTGDRVEVPSAVLIGLAAHGKAAVDRLPMLDDDDPDIDPDIAAKIARFRHCGLPYEPCPYCWEPIPYRVVQWLSGVPAPMYLHGVRNRDAELAHAATCLSWLAKEPPSRKPPSAMPLSGPGGAARPRIHH